MWAPVCGWCVGPSPQHGTHPTQIQDARRARVGGLTGLLLPNVGDVDVAGSESGRFEPPAPTRFRFDGVDGRVVVGPAAGVTDVVGAAAPRRAAGHVDELEA